MVIVGVVVVGACTKKWAIAFLVGYSFIILGETILFRLVGDVKFELQPFWSYTHPELRSQIIANIVLFIPLGFLAGIQWGWKGIPVATGFSVVIKVVQLITGRGLFEIDDVIHNTAGAVVGLGLYVLMRMLKCRLKKSGKK